MVNSLFLLTGRAVGRGGIVCWRGDIEKDHGRHQGESTTGKKHTIPYNQKCWGKSVMFGNKETCYYEGPLEECLRALLKSAMDIQVPKASS